MPKACKKEALNLFLAGKTVGWGRTHLKIPTYLEELKSRGINESILFIEPVSELEHLPIQFWPEKPRNDPLYSILCHFIS